MAEEQDGIIKPEFLQRELTMIPHREGLFFACSPFGLGAYKKNLKTMSKVYFHPHQRGERRERISFKEPTTSESISAAAYGFKNLAKPRIFDTSWLQLGYIVRTRDGVFTNIKETNEKTLKKLLNKAEKVNGIYLLGNGIAFAPYESFESDVQDCGTFANGGLARALEHKERVALKLREIASPKNYKRGIDVWGFDHVEEPVLRVAGLKSSRSIDGDRLGVEGSNHDDSYNGYAYGVLDKSASQK